jgi:NAD(P)-dependent dehydrogenase (short-subunit alcohol dehydrogenase family)
LFSWRQSELAYLLFYSTGIGYATVQHLARRGAKVYLAARNESRATGAIAKLEADGLGSGEVHWLKLDLSDPRTAKSAAEEFRKREQRLDLLRMFFLTCVVYKTNIWMK